MKCLLLLVAQFQMWDGVVTKSFAGNGLISEGNPLMAPLVADGSFLPLKIIGAIASIVLLWFVYKRFPKLAMGTAASVMLLYAAILSWNFLTVFTV